MYRTPADGSSLDRKKGLHVWYKALEVLPGGTLHSYCRGLGSNPS